MPPHTRANRGKLDMEKCERCRNDKKKCQPQGRVAAQKCDRCRLMNHPCSPSTRKRRLSLWDFYTAAPQPLSTSSEGSLRRISPSGAIPPRSWTLSHLSDALYMVQVLDQRIHKLDRFFDQVQSTFFNPDGLNDALPQKWDKLDDEVHSSLPRLKLHLLEIINPRLKLLREIHSQEKGSEIEFLNHAKQRLLLPSITAPLQKDGTEDEVLGLIDDLCLSNDFGAAYSVLQACSKWYTTPERDFTYIFCDVYKSLRRSIVVLPTEFRTAVPNEVLMRPILFRRGVWSDALTAQAPLPFKWPLLVYARDCTGATVLHNIAEETINDVEFAQLGSCPNVAIYNEGDFVGRTVLHLATAQDSLRLIPFLCSNLSTLDAKTIYGHTALHYAASLGFVQACEVILKHGADVNAEDICGRMPLYYAAARGDQNIVNLLLSQPGVNLTIDYDTNACPLWAALKQGHENTCLSIMAVADWYVGISEIKRSNTTPLHLAVGMGSLLLVRKISGEMSTEVNFICGHEGSTALSLALMKGNLDIVQTLLFHPFINTSLKDSEGLTPLHRAVMMRDLDIVTMIAERQDSSIFEKTEVCLEGDLLGGRVGETAYDIAVRCGDVNIAEVLRRFMLT